MDKEKPQAAQRAVKMAFGLPVINDRVACVVIVSHSRYKLGRKHGFTPAQVERELRRPSGPRFTPDTARKEDREALTVVPGITDADQAALYDRGIIRVDMLAPAEQEMNVEAGMLGFFKFQPQEQGRRRKAIRSFREDVAQHGVSGALERYAPEEELGTTFTLQGALAAIATDPNNDGAATFLLKHLPDADHDSLIDSLKDAFFELVGSPGNRKPETLATAILEILAD